MSKLSFWKTLCLLCVFCVVEAISSPAQTLKTVVSFNGPDGAQPAAVLVQATDGNFYGTTAGGGANSNGGFCNYPGFLCGTVFKISPTGTLTTLYNFCTQTGCTDGVNPNAGLVQATDGNFYGTTPFGGASGENDNCGYGCGTVFKITPAGALTTLYSFCSQTNCTDGALPFNGLVQATDRNLYGTTAGGGTSSACGTYGCGTTFKITKVGTLTMLYNFCSQTNCTDGAAPSGGAQLVQATDGNLYGTTWSGGTYGVGTVFKITPGGTLTTLHSFDGADGQSPNSGVVQAIDGNFYGTTAHFGTVFKMTPRGEITNLHTFGGPDGLYPYAGLVQATDGNLYGTTYVGGANDAGLCQGNGCGTAFEITPGGTLTTLYNFCAQTNCTDGAWPLAGLMQATNGKLYGTTTSGGANTDGTVFSLAVGLVPFVETRPTTGKVGTKVTILGNNLTGATSVTFNGTPASFTAKSTEITTTVPSGATTGYVKVTTSSGVLTSDVKFRVP